MFEREHYELFELFEQEQTCFDFCYTAMQEARHGGDGRGDGVPTMMREDQQSEDMAAGRQRVQRCFCVIHV